MTESAELSPRGPLLVVGGYGLVGAQAARLLRRRNPDLSLMLGGRHPSAARELAAALSASTVAIDVTAREPLASLPERPAAVLATVSDPADRLLVDAIRRGIPVADINRGGHVAVLDAAVRCTQDRPRAPVLLAGSWASGLTALAAAATAREIGPPEHIVIAVMVSPSDRVGPDSWGFSKRLAWPYYVMTEGRRSTVQPLSGARRVRCTDGRERLGVRVGTLEQVTLPLTLGAATVETRMVAAPASLFLGLIALKRSGALRVLERPALARLREALLQRSGRGDFAGLTVTAHGPGGRASVELLDVRGQAHLSAVGATLAAERVLGLIRPPLAPGLSFPEQSARPDDDLAALRQAGVVVRTTGLRSSAQGRRSVELLPIPDLDIYEEDVTA